MLSCKSASGLIEKKLHFKLSSIERFQLFMHTSMCDECKSYQQQSNDLDIMLDKHFHIPLKKSNASDKKLSADIKDKIIRDLEKK